MSRRRASTTGTLIADVHEEESIRQVGPLWHARCRCDLNFQGSTRPDAGAALVEHLQWVDRFGIDGAHELLHPYTAIENARELRLHLRDDHAQPTSGLSYQVLVDVHERERHA